MARKTPTLQIAQDATMERIAVSAVSKVGVLVPPWALLGLLTIAAAIAHAVWGAPPAVTWATMAGTLSTVTLTGLTWAVSHQRGLLGRTHSTLTTFGAGLWFTIATITGITQQVTLMLLAFGGATLAIGWNIRAVIRQTPSDAAHSGDPLATLFDQAKVSFGLKGAKVRTTEVTEHKVKGKMALPAGEKTAEDAIKNTDHMESGMKLPPGSVIVAQDEDDASQAHITFSDPRRIKQPIPWPGPSRPGASVGEPLRVALYQDGDYVEHRFTGHHLQIMGRTGSGKSIGGAWNYVAEIITRRDAAVFSIDISKDDQTMGPLRPALHRFETTKTGAVALIRQMHAEIPRRTKWLAERGYQAWEPGCGLTYWYLHLEEVAKLFSELSSEDAEKLEEIVKEIRSAGGSLLLSLQRADYTQIPTLIRSQMAKMCFGLSDPEDVKYGVSARQRKAGVHPHEWEDFYPGMAYLDAKSIRPTHYAMPLRTFSWGKTNNAANAAMRAHAAAYPASDRAGDEFTRRLAAPSSSAASDPTGGDAIPMPAAGTAAAAPSGRWADAQWEDDNEDQAATIDGHNNEPSDRPTEARDDFGELLGDAAELVITTQFASAAMLQRKLRLSHAKCLRVLEALERKGVIGPRNGTEDSRPVLVSADDAPAAQAVVERLRREGDTVSEYLRTDDPDPNVTAGPSDPIELTDEEAERFQTSDDGQPQRQMPPDEAFGLVCDWIRHRHAIGQPTFTAGEDELHTIRTKAGRKRPWIYKALKRLVDDGVLTKDETGSATTFTVADLTPLDDPGLGRAA
ncbi:DNA translocase FtsK [Actinomadura terrae]|uniref:DNA translocase FtsK n=1 Tax=Actinomadura terrae TaxID=604353 RepID=UPI001FA6E6A6|nr:DNA translocase FtsK [Actinomadura terrae]